MLATCYYLAAAVVFPSDPEDYGRLGAYYADRKRFVVAMLLAAELLVTFTFRDIFIDAARDRPAQLWVWLLPYNLLLTGAYVALLFVTSRRANIALLAALLLLFTVPYWGQGSIGAMIDRHWGYSPA